MGLARLSVGAHFACKNSRSGEFICFVTLNGDNSFSFRLDTVPICTHDGNYCVKDMYYVDKSDETWEFEIYNQGDRCTVQCPVTGCLVDGC